MPEVKQNNGIISFEEFIKKNPNKTKDKPDKEKFELYNKYLGQQELNAQIKRRQEQKQIYDQERKEKELKEYNKFKEKYSNKLDNYTLNNYTLDEEWKDIIMKEIFNKSKENPKNAKKKDDTMNKKIKALVYMSDFIKNTIPTLSNDDTDAKTKIYGEDYKEYTNAKIAENPVLHEFVYKLNILSDFPAHLARKNLIDETGTVTKTEDANKYLIEAFKTAEDLTNENYEGFIMFLNNNNMNIDPHYNSNESLKLKPIHKNLKPIYEYFYFHETNQVSTTNFFINDTVEKMLNEIVEEANPKTGTATTFTVPSGGKKRNKRRKTKKNKKRMRKTRKKRRSRK
jgi:hypothetical protein